MSDFLLRLCIEKFIEKYVIEFLLDTSFQYLKDRFRWPTALKEMYGRLSEKLPMIQAESRAIEPIRNKDETKKRKVMSSPFEGPSQTARTFKLLKDLVVYPNMEKFIDTGIHYLKYLVRRQTSLTELLERWLKLGDHIIKYQILNLKSAMMNQAVQVDICGIFLETNCNTPPKEWLWQLRDHIDEAGDALDKYEYVVSNEERLMRDKEKTKKRKVMSSLFEGASEIDKIFKGSILKMKSSGKRLQKLVHKIEQVVADDITILQQIIAGLSVYAKSLTNSTHSNYN